MAPTVLKLPTTMKASRTARWISLFLLVLVVALVFAFVVPPLFSHPIIPTIDTPGMSDVPPVWLNTP